jgi:hypothetical protein
MPGMTSQVIFGISIYAIREWEVLTGYLSRSDTCSISTLPDDLLESETGAP